MKNFRNSSESIINKKRICIVLFILLIAISLISLCAGSVMLTPSQVIRALRHGLEGNSDTVLAYRIVRYARIPRILGAGLSGMALASAGVVIQAVLNNPLAAPHIIGVNAGAGLAATIVCAVGSVSGMASMTGVIPLAAFAGAMAAVLIVIIIAEKTGASRMTLILSGVMMSSLFNAAIEAVLTFVPNALGGYTDFRTGSFSGLTMNKVLPAAIPVLLIILIVLTLAPQLEVLSLGRETAESLGMSVRPVRMLFLFLAAALSGTAVSMAGLLGFVGLIVPHMMRKMVGDDMRLLLISSVFGGALLVELCDLIARTLFLPYEMPVGIVLSFVGVPFFLWELLSERRQHHG